MDKDLFEKALELCNFTGQKSKTNFHDSNLIEFFERNCVPNEVLNFLQTFSFYEPIRFNKVTYYGNINRIVYENLYEENKRCISQGLLIIGYGLNGDFIVLDLLTLKIGFVFHDDLWEDTNVIPRDILISMNCSIGDFFYKSMTTENYPVDGFEAEKYQESS